MSIENNERELAALIRFSCNTPTLVAEDNWAHIVSQDGIYHWKTGGKIPNHNRIVLKLEHLTKYCPTGSGYDRVYPFLLKRAEERGFICPQSTRLIECSVGNAGAAFCFTARFLGYKRYIVILPQDIYPARIDQIRQLGGKILFSPPKIGPYGYIKMLQKILERKKQIRKDGAFRLYPISKIRKVPQEPYQNILGEVAEGLNKLGMEDRIDAFAFGIGAGNTISNIGRLLKKRYGSHLKVIAADFKERPFAKLLLEKLKPEVGGDWIDPEYIACTIHGVPISKLNLDVSVLSDAILLSRSDRDFALDFVNNKIGLFAGRGTATTFGCTLAHAHRVKNQTIFSIVFDSVAKYGIAKYIPLWDLNFKKCTRHYKPEPIWGYPKNKVTAQRVENLKKYVMK